MSFFRRSGSVFRFLDIIRRVILGLVFWIVIAVLIGFLVAARPPRVKKNSVLRIMPSGTLTDSSSSPIPYGGLPLGNYPAETLLDNLVLAIRKGKNDARIQGIWLQLDFLHAAGPAVAGELADALKNFAESGKPIIASSDSYDNARYRIASSADYIITDRLGEVFPVGYGVWRAYLGEGIAKFGGEVNLFRSGESKSAAENLIGSEMSETARKNSRQLLEDLWKSWTAAVAENRHIAQTKLEEWIDNYDKHLMDAGGNAPLSAQKARLIDAVETGGILEAELEKRFGEDYATIEAADYIARTGRGKLNADIIAVIPINGVLIYGEGQFGQAGSTDVISALENVRTAPGIGALVLRINSPGGDVRAAEAIRRSVQEISEKWNLPVIASLGNMAASGGYWIALEADSIVSRPETITGSIGVYSVAMNFTSGLALLGIHYDGLGTTPWTGAGHFGRRLDERTALLYESAVKDIDAMFRDLTAQKRNLPMEAVNELAGGIPWSGNRAYKLKLVDHIGSLDDAVRLAAEQAGLKNWKTIHFTKNQNARELILNQLLWGRVRK
ncbi:MAG: signal peptide peptidase SppA [Spirochaeta sp. LUC14_002_19_P3]|nr:MAG: signal peptide peptidase SppA [Spirochaeta sp. LUC14_002_19_P3]